MTDDRGVGEHVERLGRQRAERRQREPEDLAVVRRAEAHRARTIMRAMKIGIVVPYSWSFWGGVVEHAELQADALKGLGHEVRTIMGNDPPGQFTRVLHPRHGRHGSPPPDVIPIGRSVIVPANGTLPNIILSPRSVFRIRQALESARRWLPGDYEVVPNGVLIPPQADPGGRENRVVFAGRHENRKGLHVLLQAWPEIRRRTGATLRVCGADPLRVRLLMTRLRVPDDGIEVLGFLPQEEFTEQLLAAKALVAPSLGGESFGIVLTRALACATPVAASDIPGYRDVMTPETTVSFPPGDVGALVAAVERLLADEPRRQAMGAAGRRLAQERYAWDAIARRLVDIYESLVAVPA